MVRASVIVPTFREAENIGRLIEGVFSVFPEAELIVVDDDSPDGTARIAEGYTSRYDMKVLCRKGERGLASAVIAGFKLASNDIIGVIDADFSHPLESIPELVRKVEEGCDLVVGSRYTRGGRIENWPLLRRLTSRGAKLLARPLTSVKDPVSGFFFLRKKVLEGVSLNPTGYKIGLEVIVKGNYRKVAEVPITFTDRKVGKSKLSLREYRNYLIHLLRLYTYKLGF
ncbi:MAG: polyprenol monophosphomannose synthase [Candidatus Altiarchaeota archaeon]